MCSDSPHLLVPLLAPSTSPFPSSSLPTPSLLPNLITHFPSGLMSSRAQHPIAAREVRGHRAALPPRNAQPSEPLREAGEASMPAVTLSPVLRSPHCQRGGQAGGFTCCNSVAGGREEAPVGPRQTRSWTSSWWSAPAPPGSPCRSPGVCGRQTLGEKLSATAPGPVRPAIKAPSRPLPPLPLPVTLSLCLLTLTSSLAPSRSRPLSRSPLLPRETRPARPTAAPHRQSPPPAEPEIRWRSQPPRRRDLRRRFHGLQVHRPRPSCPSSCPRPSPWNPRAVALRPLPPHGGRMAPGGPGRCACSCCPWRIWCRRGGTKLVM